MNTQKNKIAAIISSVVFALSVASLSATGRLSVDFQDPEKYTDIEMGAITTDKDRQYIVDQLRTKFENEAERVLPNGYTMRIIVKDVDLAGDQSPLYSINQDIRIYKDIFTPKLKLAYQVMDETGSMAAEGDVRLTDLNYLWDLSIGRKEITYYVNNLIEDWMRQDLRKSLK